MVSEYAGQIIDSDRHILEDMPAILELLPSRWRESAALRRQGPLPSRDHMHNLLNTVPLGQDSSADGPEGWHALMDAVGIGTAILYPTDALTYGKIIDNEIAIELASAYNVWLSETYVNKSQRFEGMALIPMQEPVRAVEELRRAVEELGLRGAMLPGSGLKANLAAKEYWPIYEEADRLGCCLAVHGGSSMNLGFNDLNVFAGIHAMGYPFVNTIAFTCMTFNGIFDKFPNVRFGFLGGGVGWFLMALERCDVSYKSFTPIDHRGELLKLEANESVAGYIKRQCEEGRIFIGVTGDEPHVDYAVKRVGSQSLMYATDVPHGADARLVSAGIDEIAESEQLTQADKEAILFKNAERFYGLHPAKA